MATANAARARARARVTAKTKTKRQKLSRTKITSPLRYLRALLSVHTPALTHTHTDFTYVNCNFHLHKEKKKEDENYFPAGAMTTKLTTTRAKRGALLTKTKTELEKRPTTRRRRRRRSMRRDSLATRQLQQNYNGFHSRAQVTTLVCRVRAALDKPKPKHSNR